MGGFRWTVCALLFAATTINYMDRQILGLGGMVGSITAMAFSQSTGLILEKTGSYWTLFAIAGSAYVVALTIMHLLIPDLKPAKLDHA